MRGKGGALPFQQRASSPAAERRPHRRAAQRHGAAPRKAQHRL